MNLALLATSLEERPLFFLVSPTQSSQEKQHKAQNSRTEDFGDPRPQLLTHSSKSWLHRVQTPQCALLVLFRCDPVGWRAYTLAYFGTAVDEDFKFCSGEHLQWAAFYENNTYCRHLNIFPLENKEEGKKKMVHSRWICNTLGLIFKGKKILLAILHVPYNINPYTKW
jgi:hypothetical protein